MKYEICLIFTLCCTGLETPGSPLMSGSSREWWGLPSLLFVQAEHTVMILKDFCLLSPVFHLCSLCPSVFLVCHTQNTWRTNCLLFLEVTHNLNNLSSCESQGNQVLPELHRSCRSSHNSTTQSRFQRPGKSPQTPRGWITAEMPSAFTVYSLNAISVNYLLPRCYLCGYLLFPLARSWVRAQEPTPHYQQGHTDLGFGSHLFSISLTAVDFCQLPGALGWHLRKNSAGDWGKCAGMIHQSKLTPRSLLHCCDTTSSSFIRFSEALSSVPLLICLFRRIIVFSEVFQAASWRHALK